MKEWIASGELWQQRRLTALPHVARVVCTVVSVCISSEFRAVRLTVRLLRYVCDSWLSADADTAAAADSVITAVTGVVSVARVIRIVRRFAVLCRLIACCSVANWKSRETTYETTDLAQNLLPVNSPKVCVEFEAFRLVVSYYVV